MNIIKQKINRIVGSIGAFIGIVVFIAYIPQIIANLQGNKAQPFQPVSALAIIAADDNAGLVQAIETKNITYLTKFPKIGKKTAQQMVLDLEGKVVVAGDDLPAKVAVQASAENQELEEAMEAMLALGYKATELKKIKKFFEGTTDTAENYIKSALKMLVK